MSTSGSHELDWTWSDADPDHWNVEESADGVTGWTVVDTVAGSGRGDTGFDNDMYYRVIGEDSSNTPVTDYSNVVYVT